MTWTTFHRRGEILRTVIATTDERRDGVLPMDLDGVAETFGDEFTVLMAEAFGVSEARAATWTAKMRGAQTHTEESIRRSLLACALGA